MRSWGLGLVLALAWTGCDGDMGMDAGALDAGAADAGGGDAGVDAAVPMCPDHFVDPWPGPAPCSMATEDCAIACDDLGCVRDCVAADPDPDCAACWDFNTQSCWNRNGCQPLWNCLAACFMENCPGGLTPECFDACSAEDQAYADCFEPLRPMCGLRGADCFPMGMM